MKNLFYLPVVLLVMSCGTTEETDVVITPVTEETIVTEETVVEDTTFDVTEIETVGELLDTLETIGTVVNE